MGTRLKEFFKKIYLTKFHRGDKMKKVFKFLILLLILNTICISMAEEIKYPITKEECKEVATLFLDKIIKNNIEDAFSIIEKYFPAHPLVKNNLQSTKLQIMNLMDSQITPLFGKAISYEIIKVESIKDVALRLVYIEKFERSFAQWTFIFYKVTDKWNIVAINLNADPFSVFQ